MASLDVAVECRSRRASGAAGPQEPVSLRFSSGEATPVEVLDRWPGDGYCYFRVRSEPGDLFILRHDERAGVWQVHFFRAGARS